MPFFLFICLIINALLIYFCVFDLFSLLYLLKYQLSSICLNALPQYFL